MTGALPAAAAGIAMAAEVSAGIKIDMNAFEYNGYNKEAKALTFTHHNQDWESPITFSVSGEKAGATYHFCEKDGDDMTSTKWNIWVKPIDLLTVNVGNWESELNQETIYYGGTQSKIGSQGLTLTLAPVDGFTFDFVVAPGWGNAWFKDKKTVAVEEIGDDLEDDAKGWYETAKYTGDAAAYDDYYKDNKSDIIDAYLDHYIDTHDTDPAIAELGFKAAYSADFGTVSAIFDAKDNFKNLKFGAGYKNTFDPLTVWVNVLGVTDRKHDDKKKVAFDHVRVEAFEEVGIDALKVKAFEAFQFNTNLADGAKTNDKIDIAAFLYLGYNLGDATPYLKIKDEDFLQKKFAMIINPGVEFKVGDCSIDAGLEIDTSVNDDKVETGKVGVSVPVKFSMSF
ncbi:MAG: hypothetical protein VZR56_04315 [Treponema sp.]|nr:hypothetical protein [Treponema sp.]